MRQYEVAALLLSETGLPCAEPEVRACMQVYAGHFLLPDGTPYIGSSQRPPPGAPHLMGTTEEIENLRPKSPQGGRG